MATESVEIMLKLPKSVLALMDSTETSIGQTIMETVAVALYHRRQISLGKAAEIAGISVWQMNQILAKHDVSLDYTAEDAAQDWNTLREVLKT
jgi:predicted HTH domain antitoxin